MADHDLSKREFLKTVGYVAPVILTLSAIPSFAQTGSGRGGGNGGGRGGGRP